MILSIHKDILLWLFVWRWSSCCVKTSSWSLLMLIIIIIALNWLILYVT